MSLRPGTNQKQSRETLFDWIQGSPEGNNYGPAGYVVVDELTGEMWIKTTAPELKTGWQKFFTAGTLLEFMSFDTIAELRDDTLLFNKKPAIVWGQNAPLDRLGGGIFRYSSTSTAVDDNISIIRPTVIPVTSPGRYEQFI